MPVILACSKCLVGRDTSRPHFELEQFCELITSDGQRVLHARQRGGALNNRLPTRRGHASRRGAGYALVAAPNVQHELVAILVEKRRTEAGVVDAV